MCIRTPEEGVLWILRRLLVVVHVLSAVFLIARGLSYPVLFERAMRPAQCREKGFSGAAELEAGLDVWVQSIDCEREHAIPRIRIWVSTRELDDLRV